VGFNRGIKDGGDRLLEGLGVVSSSFPVRIRVTWGRGAEIGSMSRSKMAEVDEWTAPTTLVMVLGA